MPSMRSAVSRHEETLGFEIVKKTVVDHELIETSKFPVAVYFEGTLLPMNPRELLIKTEGERKFKWWTLFTDFELPVDTVVKDENGLEYRVMASSDWRDAGFSQYQLIEGPGI